MSAPGVYVADWAAEVDRSCGCGSERITFAGGTPLTCAESLFTLQDEDAIWTHGDPIPALSDASIASGCQCARCVWLRGVHAHLLETLVWDAVADAPAAVRAAGGTRP